MREKGQSLFEVVVALAISALIIIALVSLVSNSIQNANFSKNKTLAGVYVQEATEWLRGQRDNDIDTFSTNISNSQQWCLQDLSWSNPGLCEDDATIANTIFLREVDFTTTTDSGKTIIQADIMVFWVDSKGLHTVKSATNFSDWRER